MANAADEYGAEFLPDGKWIAYISDHSGRCELYMRRLDGGLSTQITTSGAIGFQWSSNGAEFHVHTPTNERVTILITYRDNTVLPGKPSALFTPPPSTTP